MKRLYISVILLASVTAACFLTNRYQRQVVSVLLEDLQQMEQQYDNGDREGCRRSSEAFVERYEKITAPLFLYMDHEELSTALEIASTLPVILRQDDTAHFPAELARCRSMLRRLEKRERVSIENVL